MYLGQPTVLLLDYKELEDVFVTIICHNSVVSLRQNIFPFEAYHMEFPYKSNTKFACTLKGSVVNQLSKDAFS